MIGRHECVTLCYEVPGQTWPSELCWLYDTFGKSRYHAEVGVYCGRSLLASCGGMASDSKVIAVDDDSQAMRPAWVKAVRHETYKLMPVKVQEFDTDSLSTAIRCHNEGLTFDSVFIDACHEYAECLADISAWRSLVRPGGIISGHDYWPAHVGVMDAVNKFFGSDFEVVPQTRIWFARVASKSRKL